MQAQTNTLINFNIPTYLKDNLDDLTRFKNVSRTSILNRLIENYCRVEYKYIEKDGRFRDMLSKAKHKNSRMTKPKVLQEYLTAKPLHKSVVELDEEYSPPDVPILSNTLTDDYDWEKDRWG